VQKQLKNVDSYPVE